MVLSIRKAEESDTEIIGSIFAVARQFMARTGNPTQWGNSSPDMNLVAGDIRRKECYVIESDGKIVATFAMVKGRDPHYSAIDNGEHYLTLHRVATDGSIKGLMPLIFQWADMHSPILRIDTHAANAPMLNRIEEAGFVFDGIVTMDDGSPRRAFHRRKQFDFPASDIINRLKSMQDSDQRKVLMRFFKTGTGEYGEGDEFLGLKVPQTRQIVKEYRLKVPFHQIALMLGSEWHEVRLCALLLLVEEMKKAQGQHASLIADFYLDYAERANNWDLVDLSAPYIIGEWLSRKKPDGKLPSTDILIRLSSSENLWRQRIAIVSTYTLIRSGIFEPTLALSKKYLTHKHDLIHKATGWMLREMGKRDLDALRGFLDTYQKQMPRTALRYAIEKLSAEERRRRLAR